MTFPGFVSSCKQAVNTVTVNEHVAVLPAVSVAVQFTVVVPTGKAAPDGGTQTTLAEQLSVTVGLKFTVAVVDAGQVNGATAVMFAGQVITGGIGSTVVVVVAELLPGVGSGIELCAVTVLLMTVPCSVPALTLTTIWNTAVSPAATDAFEKTMLPLPLPTAGVAVLQPLPVVTVAETKVVLAGIGSVTVVFSPGPGPLSTKLIV